MYSKNDIRFRALCALVIMWNCFVIFVRAVLVGPVWILGVAFAFVSEKTEDLFHFLNDNTRWGLSRPLSKERLETIKELRRIDAEFWNEM